MTNRDKRHNQNRSDKNLDRLLELGEPVPWMPEDLKARIRSRLAEMEPKSGRNHFLPGHWAMWPLAATAVLIFFFIIFWSGGSTDTIVWADVREQLSQVHTMTFTAHTRVSEATEMRIAELNKVYHKDPGLTRTEEYALDTDSGSIEEEPRRIVIFRREPGSSEGLILHPGSSRAELLTTIFLANALEPPYQSPMDLASINWNLMKEIREDKTKRIGDRVINGIPSVGFGFEKPDGQVRGQLWAGREDGVPLFIEVEHIAPQTQNMRWEISDIRWNAPLEESLFDLVVPDGWSLSRTRTELAEYTDAGLAPGVTLQIGPEGQEPLAAIEDLAGVVRGEQIIHPDSGIPREVSITIELKPDSMQRLRDYTEAYPDELIVVGFNGQIKVAANLYWASQAQLSFDLSLLDLSLAELEARYFTTAIERNIP